ncbi:MAG: hypothetical protein N3A02_02965 [Rectinema sp.]|nr:hypothetical protein [Rectinema sp.]
MMLKNIPALLQLNIQGSTGTSSTTSAVEVVQPDFADEPVRGVYTSDLLSDVLANGRDATVLVTIQAHRNTVAVASITGIRLILICNNRPVDPDMIDAARQEGIGVLRTTLSQFEVSGRLWQALHS